MMGGAGIGSVLSHYGFGKPTSVNDAWDWGSLHSLCQRQLFDEYLPFWERGGIDETHGGFMCYLYDDGSVENDRKDIWYQGRGIWVYSYLYNELDKQAKWLEVFIWSTHYRLKMEITGIRNRGRKKETDYSAY